MQNTIILQPMLHVLYHIWSHLRIPAKNNRWSHLGSGLGFTDKMPLLLNQVLSSPYDSSDVHHLPP